MSDDSKLEKTIGAVKELAEVVPVYQDLMQPAFKQVGKGLETVAKTVNVALAPLKVVVWGYEQIEQFVTARVAERLKDVPEERIVTPDLTVAGPAVESLKFSGHKEELREMYASLLATSMDKETADRAHPAFVEIIRQFTPDEAKLMNTVAILDQTAVLDIEVIPREGWSTNATGLHNLTALGIFSHCQYPNLLPNYIDNLLRLRLIEKHLDMSIRDENQYDQIRRWYGVESWKEQIMKLGPMDLVERRGVIRKTSFGKQFIEACVMPTLRSSAKEKKTAV